MASSPTVACQPATWTLVWSRVWPAYGLMSEAQAPRAPAKGPSAVTQPGSAQPTGRGWGHLCPTSPPGSRAAGGTYLDTWLWAAVASTCRSLLNSALPLAQAPGLLLHSTRRCRSRRVASKPLQAFSNIEARVQVPPTTHDLDPSLPPGGLSPPPQHHACS